MSLDPPAYRDARPVDNGASAGTGRAAVTGGSRLSATSTA